MGLGLGGIPHWTRGLGTLWALSSHLAPPSGFIQFPKTIFSLGCPAPTADWDRRLKVPAERDPEPGTVLNSQGIGTDLLLPKHFPFKQACWKHLHFSGFVLDKAKGEQSNFKSRDITSENRSPFMLPFILLFTPLLARWIVFAHFVMKLVEQSAPQKVTVTWHRLSKPFAEGTSFLPVRAYLCKRLWLKQWALLAVFATFVSSVFITFCIFELQ